MGLKLAVVGGGSTYTPELIEGIALRAARLPVDELVLLDIDPERLEIVGGLAQRMLNRLEWPGTLTLSGDTDAAIDGASFVLIQLRVAARRRASSTRRSRPGSARSARRPPARVASRRRCAPSRSCSTSPSEWGSGRLREWTLTSSRCR